MHAFIISQRSSKRQFEIVLWKSHKTYRLHGCGRLLGFLRRCTMATTLREAVHQKCSRKFVICSNLQLARTACNLSHVECPFDIEVHRPTKTSISCNSSMMCHSITILDSKVSMVNTGVICRLVALDISHLWTRPYFMRDEISLMISISRNYGVPLVYRSIISLFIRMS
jgi:hypothetical protein